MRLRLVPAPRRLPWPWWSVALVTIWIGLGAAAKWLMEQAGHDVPLCLFRRLTGIPCPTCGTTRAAMNLLAGRLLYAWLCNPFAVTFGGMLAGVLVLRLAAGRRLQLELSRRQMRIVTLGLVVVVLVNWAYVIAFVG